MKTLAALANGKAKTVSVKALLHQEMSDYDDRRSITNLHASDLTNNDTPFCPREIILLRKLGRTRGSVRIPPALRYTFDEGNDKQWRFNNDWLRRYMVGDWECIRCGKVKKWSRYPVEKTCHNGSCEYEYKEPRFIHPLGPSGGIDAIVDLGLPKLRIVETKIMGNNYPREDFKNLLAPLAEHRIRTRLYLKLIAESNVPHLEEIDTSVAHVLYMLRGHGIKDDQGEISPFKEFIVQRNDVEVENYLQLALAVKACEGLDAYPKGVCSDSLCKRAGDCRVSKECFSGEYPGTITWNVNGTPKHE